jgi:hypothetical protein
MEINPFHPYFRPLFLTVGESWVAEQWQLIWMGDAVKSMNCKQSPIIQSKRQFLFQQLQHSTNNSFEWRIMKLILL